MYTYQFSPIVNKQFDLFENSVSVEERMSKKQDYLNEFLNNQTLRFSYRGRVYQHRILFADSGIYIIRIANSRNLHIEHDFKKTYIENSPSSVVIIDNRNDVQRVLIEDNSSQFSNTDVVKKVLYRTFSNFFNDKGLEFDIQKEYQVSEFWDYIKKYPNSIKLIRFQLSYPNLPRVTQCISELIKETSKSVNSHLTKIELNAGADKQLHISEDNETINDLNQASANSGQPIILKVSGIKSHISTGCSTKTVTIDNIEMSIPGRDLFSDIDNLKNILDSIDETNS